MFKKNSFDSRSAKKYKQIADFDDRASQDNENDAEEQIQMKFLQTNFKEDFEEMNEIKNKLLQILNTKFQMIKNNMSATGPSATYNDKDKI